MEGRSAHWNCTIKAGSELQWQLEEFTGMLLDSGLGDPVRHQKNMHISSYTLRPQSSAWQKQSLEGAQFSALQHGQILLFNR